jgi:hypothetical protein
MPESKSTSRQRKLRLENLEKYGARCASPDCRWVNEDGTKGCTDVRALQFDHVDGGGSSELKYGYGAGLAHLYRVKKDTTGRYQVLCANCNWIKRHADREARGVDQHKRPALLRAALQIEGQPLRRVTGGG